MSGSPAVRAAILARLHAAGVPHELRVHRPLVDAADAALLRGAPLAWGVKAVVMRTVHGLEILAFSAARAMDNRAVRHHLRSSKLRFATAAELEALGGLAPGCVPPVGAPVLAARLHLDRGLLALPRIAFTPGVPDASILLDPADHVLVWQPILGDFTRDPAG